MKIANVLKSMASWLENPNNEALLVAENNNECLAVVAAYCVEASEILKKAADEVSEIEPQTSLTAEGIDGLAELANALDSSDDPELKKQASLIDDLLITVSAPKGAFKAKKAEEERKIEELSDKFYNKNDEIKDVNKVADLEKDLNDLNKKHKHLENPLSMRYCPDHPGANLIRIGENVWQCEMDKKKYDFSSGFELMNGSKVPGGDVSYQTDYFQNNEFAQFDTRDGRLNSNKP